MLHNVKDADVRFTLFVGLDARELHGWNLSHATKIFQSA